MRALLATLIATPSDPAVHRELVEHLDVTRRRQHVRKVHDRVATLFAQFLADRRDELRPFVDAAAMLFVLGHAIAAATHATSFYRPDALPLTKVLDALTEVVTRALLPAPAARTSKRARSRSRR